MSTPFQKQDQADGRDALIELLKRVTKLEKKRLGEQGQDVALSTLHNGLAVNLGYRNWSLFHKDVLSMPASRLRQLMARIDEAPEIQAFKMYNSVDKVAAREEMRDYVESNFSPLSHFAFYDSESETGYAWPDVNLVEELSEEFGDRFPHAMIEEVATELELDQGPWGREDFDDDGGDSDGE